MKVVRLLALRTGRFYPQDSSLVLIPIRVWVDPRAIVWQEGLSQQKILLIQWIHQELNLQTSGF